MKFIKDSIRDFKHVVWPTREETKKYFIIVLVILILFGLYLFIANTLFSKGVFYLREIVGTKENVSVEKNTDLDNFLPENQNVNLMSEEVNIDTETNENQTKIQTGSVNPNE